MNTVDWRNKNPNEFLDIPQKELPLSLVATINKLAPLGYLNCMDGFVEVVAAWQRHGADHIIGERELLER